MLNPLPRGSLAQLVEQLTLNQRVNGSSPLRSTISFNRLAKSKNKSKFKWGLGLPRVFKWDTGGIVRSEYHRNVIPTFSEPLISVRDGFNV